MRFQRKDKLAKAAIVIHETSNILYTITTALYIRTSKNDSSLSNERGELFYGYWAVSKTWFLRSILSYCDVKIVIHDGFSITSS